MDNEIVTYIVIWNGKEFTTNDYEKAFKRAEEFTCGELEHDTALLITRREWFGDFPEVQISKVQALRCVIEGVYELVNLTI